MAHTLFRGNDAAPCLTDSHFMTPRSHLSPASNAPLWLHRLHLQFRWALTDVLGPHRLPLFRLVAAVLVALLALGTASGLISSP